MSTVIVTGSTTLKVLDVGGNNTSDGGISMISEELEHNNSLTELRVVRCGLSVKGEEVKFCILSFLLVSMLYDYFHT